MAALHLRRGGRPAGLAGQLELRQHADRVGPGRQLDEVRARVVALGQGAEQPDLQRQAVGLGDRLVERRRPGRRYVRDGLVGEHSQRQREGLVVGDLQRNRSGG